jgi:hypothetical protein
VSDERHDPTTDSQFDVHTVCHECNGAGVSYQQTTATVDGQRGTAVTALLCPECGSTGGVRGFIPPV